MNQPTREEFDQLKEQQKNFDKRLKEVESRQTEPIPATTRIEVASADVLNQLKALEQGQQELREKAKRLDMVQEDTNTLKIQMEGARSDILQIRESQADFRDRLVEHGQRLESIEQKQDAHSEILDKLVDFAESHEKNMATKDDISAIKAAQTEQGDILKLVLAELRKPRGE